MNRMNTNGIQMFQAINPAGKASRWLLVALSFLLMMWLAPAAAQLVKVPVSSGGGNIEWPEPFEGDDRFPPGCMIKFSSPPGLLGPPCAIKCTGSAVEAASGWNVQRECSAHPENSYNLIDSNGEPIPADQEDNYDRDNSCTIIKGKPGKMVGKGLLPHGHPRCHGVSGEPHLSTFDDLRYDLQAAGEFIASKSLDDNLEVQVRLEPFHSFTYLTVATAVAARLGDSRVMIAARPDTPLRINGEPVELEQGFLMLGEDDGSMILRRESGYSLVWPDGTNLHIELVSHHLDFFLLGAEPRDGRWVGLAGDADGDGGNDFRTREGESLAAPPEFETLYKVFAESWRITQEESLFDYAEGESTATFTNREIPSRRVTMEDLDPAARADAETRCRASGVVEAEALEQCIFDVALTGDDAFIESALILQTPPEFRDPEAVSVQLLSPRQVAAGSEFAVTWVGPVNHQDAINITELAPPHTRVDWTYAKTGAPVMLRAPVAPGEYEVNYVTAPSRTVLATESLTVTPVTAHLQVPPEVPAGSEFEVTWEGPDNHHDTITITEDSPPHSRVEWKYADGGSPTILRAPPIPGEYAVNYMMAQSRTALASEPLMVTAVAATLHVPSEVPAGSEFEVAWEGPGNPHHVIAIARVDAAPNSYISWKYTRTGSPITVPAPDEPGKYEVRYVMGHSGHVLETSPFEVR